MSRRLTCKFSMLHGTSRDLDAVIPIAVFMIIDAGTASARRVDQHSLHVRMTEVGFCEQACHRRRDEEGGAF